MKLMKMVKVLAGVTVLSAMALVFLNLPKDYVTYAATPGNATSSNATPSNSGGSGGGGGGVTARGSAGNKSRIYVPGTDGKWELVNSGKWVFTLNSGTKLGGWNKISYKADGKTIEAWYYFGADNIMQTGWFFDTSSSLWYYLSESNDAHMGAMQTGWKLYNNKWYLLKDGSGYMLTGWRKVGDAWYYLNNDSTRRPLGEMYSNERTPDNYFVDASGAWVQ